MTQIIGLILTIFVLFLFIGAVVLYMNELEHRRHMKVMRNKRAWKNEEAEAKAEALRSKELLAWGTSIGEFGEDSEYYLNMTQFMEEDPEFTEIFGDNQYLMAQYDDLHNEHNNQCGGTISTDNPDFFDNLYSLGEDLSPAETTVVDNLPILSIPAFVPKDERMDEETDPLIKDIVAYSEGDENEEDPTTNKFAQMIAMRGDDGRVKEIVDAESFVYAEEGDGTGG